jgi:hypothetical protein
MARNGSHRDPACRERRPCASRDPSAHERAALGRCAGALRVIRSGDERLESRWQRGSRVVRGVRFVAVARCRVGLPWYGTRDSPDGCSPGARIGSRCDFGEPAYNDRGSVLRGARICSRSLECSSIEAKCVLGIDGRVSHDGNSDASATSRMNSAWQLRRTVARPGSSSSAAARPKGLDAPYGLPDFSSSTYQASAQRSSSDRFV